MIKKYELLWIINQLNMIKENKIISVITIHDSNLAVDLAKCLYDSGIRNLEITLRTKDAKKAIELILNADLDLNIGIGTVLNKQDLHFAKKIGSNFGLSPCTDLDLIQESKKINFKFIPGVSNASEINSCVKLGCEVLKLFPAIQMGGIAYFNSIYSPFKSNNLKFIALGGINSGNAKEFIDDNNFVGVGASWIADYNLIKKRDWKEITRRANDILNL